MESSRYCPNCMRELEEGVSQCPYCQFDIAGYTHSSNALRLFTVLQGKYMVGRVLGQGGFGITYIGWDLNLQTYIAIKEYFPDSIVNRDTTQGVTTPTIKSDESREAYQKGLVRYVEEARNLSKFYQLAGIVSVKDFFYENNTGYIVMEYLDGINLKQYLDEAGGKLDEKTVLELMRPVFESMYQIHNAGLVHRDISPDNIMVNGQGKIKLIDFGSARGQSTVVPEATYTVVLKHGYAPPEQYYAKGNQGPWTDIYSLCATMYKMLTGEIPPNSIERMDNDTYKPASAYGVNLSERTERVLAKGLSVKLQDRYKNIGELLTDLYPDSTVAAGTDRNMPGYISPKQTSDNREVSQNIKSMRLSEGAKPGNKKLMAGIFAAIAVIIIVIACILIFGGNDGEMKPGENISTEDGVTEDNTAEDSQTEHNTEEVTPQTEDEPQQDPEAELQTEYVPPSELSDDWQDYTLRIGDDLYSFPMPYAVFREYGWKASSAPDEIAAGNNDYVYCKNDAGYEICIIVGNYTAASLDTDKCYAIGIVFLSYADYTGLEVELGGGIRLLESTGDDIKNAYGAPDYTYEGADYTDYVYYDDDIEDGIYLTTNEEGLLYEISIMNTALPDGVSVDLSDISQEVPEINSLYTPPEQMTDACLDCIIQLDEKMYQLPCPVSEFLEDGWTLDTSAPDYIAGNSEEWCVKLQKNGNSIEVDIRNYNSDAILPANGYVTAVELDDVYCDLYLEISGGIIAGETTSDEIIAIFEEQNIDYDVNDYDSFVAIHARDEDYEKSISVYVDPGTGVVEDVSIEYSPYTLR